jgi:predicted N-acetyltransferase YhbS
MIEIREATYTDDIEAFAELGRRDHERSRYASIPYCVGTVMKLLVTMIDQRMLFIAEDEGRVVGAMGALLSPVHFNDAVLAGCMRFWWVDLPYQKTRLAVRLLDRLEQQARALGCKAWYVSAVTFDEARDLRRLFRRRGYVLAEHEWLLLM